MTFSTKSELSKRLESIITRSKLMRNKIKIMIYLSIILFFFLDIASISKEAANIPITRMEVLDCDTVKVTFESGNKFSIRLIGIDCFETEPIHRAYKQAYYSHLSIDQVVYKGCEAKIYLENLHKKAKNISFVFQGIDKYGRALGILYFDNININQHLLDKGLCLPYVYKEK